jgi:hypothetical protein
MRRRRLFALAGGASAAATLPAIAAPMVEMHAADIAPVAPVVERYISDFGTICIRPTDINSAMRRMMADLRADIERQVLDG